MPLEDEAKIKYKLEAKSIEAHQEYLNYKAHVARQVLRLNEMLWIRKLMNWRKNCQNTFLILT